MLIDILLAATIVAVIGVPLVIAFDKAKREMEAEEEERGDE